MTTPRLCVICNSELSINEWEYPKAFAQRQTCDGDCVKRLRALRVSEQRRKPFRSCVICGSELQRGEDEGSGNYRKRQTCGDECRRSLLSQKRQLVQLPKPCAHCGTLFSRRPDESAFSFGHRKSCSRECQFRMRSGDLPPVRVCVVCHTEFGKQDGETSQRYLLRMTCGDTCKKQYAVILMRRNAATPVKTATEPKTCPVCNASFNRRSDEKMCGYKLRRTCSRTCARQLALARSDARSGIELATRSALRAAGIEFVEQKPIGAFVVDFWLPTSRTVIECNGDYWHCNPSMFPDGPQHRLVVERVERDRALEEMIDRRGMRLLVLWESDIKEVGAANLILSVLGDTIAA